MTSKERVHIPPSFGIETFYVAQKLSLWYLQYAIKNFNFVISSAIWMKIGMSIEVNFETSNPFRSCEIVQWFSRYSILYSTCRGKITRTVNIGERHTSCHTALGH